MLPAHPDARPMIALRLGLALARIGTVFCAPVPAIPRQVVDAGVLVDPHHCIAGAGWGCVSGLDYADQGGG